MSTLKVTHLQNENGTGPAMSIAVGGGVTFAGITTFHGNVDLGSNSLSGDLTGSVTGSVTVATGATISGSANVITASTNGSERLRIDSSGNAILKTANAAFKAENPNSSGDYLRMYAGSGTSQWDIYTNGELLRMGDNSGNAAAKVQFDNPTFHRSTSNTTGVAALTAKQEVNNGGYLIFDGKNSSDTTVFGVTHNGRINLSENIVFASGQGLDFSATAGSGISANGGILDDYEEGTFTATMQSANNNATISTSNTTGYYIKVGGKVSFTYYTSVSSCSNAGTGGARLKGLPFTSSSSTHEYWVCSVSHNNAFFSNTIDGGYVSNTNNEVVFQESNATTTATFAIGSTRYLMVSGTYSTV